MAVLLFVWELTAYEHWSLALSEYTQPVNCSRYKQQLPHVNSDILLKGGVLWRLWKARRLSSTTRSARMTRRWSSIPGKCDCEIFSRLRAEWFRIIFKQVTDSGVFRYFPGKGA
jgi:hypothetical protein